MHAYCMSRPYYLFPSHLHTHIHADIIATLLWSLFWFAVHHVGQGGTRSATQHPVPALFPSLLSNKGRSPSIKYDSISFWFSLDLREITADRARARKKGMNRENTTWVKHQWEWRRDGESQGVRGRGWDDETQLQPDLWRAGGKCRDNFKRAPWNIQHTTAAAAAAAWKPRTSRCAVFQLVVFSSCSPLIFSLTGRTSVASSEDPVKHKLLEYRLLSFRLLNFGFVKGFYLLFERNMTVRQMWLFFVSPSLFKPISPSISFHASHPSLALSTSPPPPALLCMCPFSWSVHLSICLSLSILLFFFLHVYVCAGVHVVDADETVIHDLLRVFLSEDIRSSTTHTLSHTHICRQRHTHASTYVGAHTYTHT